MGDEKPLATINIVTRNRRAPLKRAIESAYAQTYRPIEIVVVDNDSTDGTAEMVEECWPDIHLIRVHRNTGCQPGRNLGMKNSRGKYIFNLDDDGTLEPTALERIVARFEAEPDVAVVAAAIRPMSADRAALVTERQFETERYVSGFPGGASAIRASTLEKTGYYPEYVLGHAEADLALRIIDQGYEIVYLPDAIMYHEVSDLERSKVRTTYYEVWHRLETRVRLEPWRHCLANLAWKTGVEFIASIRRGSVLGYLAGVLRFLYALPRILVERRPISNWAMQKADFLGYNYVTNRDVLRNFKRFTMWQVAGQRLRRKHLQRAPDGHDATRAAGPSGKQRS